MQTGFFQRRQCHTRRFIRYQKSASKYVMTPVVDHFTFPDFVWFFGIPFIKYRLSVNEDYSVNDSCSCELRANLYFIDKTFIFLKNHWVLVNKNGSNSIFDFEW